MDITERREWDEGEGEGQGDRFENGTLDWVTNIHEKFPKSAREIWRAPSCEPYFRNSNFLNPVATFPKSEFNWRYF